MARIMNWKEFLADHDQAKLTSDEKKLPQGKDLWLSGPPGKIQISEKKLNAYFNRLAGKDPLLFYKLEDLVTATHLISWTDFLDTLKEGMARFFCQLKDQPYNLVVNAEQGVILKHKNEYFMAHVFYELVFANKYPLPQHVVTLGNLSQQFPRDQVLWLVVTDGIWSGSQMTEFLQNLGIETPYVHVITAYISIFALHKLQELGVHIYSGTTMGTINEILAKQIPAVTRQPCAANVIPRARLMKWKPLPYVLPFKIANSWSSFPDQYEKFLQVPPLSHEFYKKIIFPLNIKRARKEQNV